MIETFIREIWKIGKSHQRVQTEHQQTQVKSQTSQLAQAIWAIGLLNQWYA